MTYLVPTTLEDALQMIAHQDLDIIAGCTDFFPAKQAGPIAKGLLDISRLADVKGISQSGENLRIGAATTWTEIARADLPAAFIGLQQAAREVGSLQIQNAGTVGGNICNASPAADGVPPLLALGAKVELQSARGVRLVSLSEFITGVRSIALEADEMVTALVIPPLPQNAVGAFTKLGSRRYLVISITMTAVVIALDEEGLIDFARVAIGACSPVAQRLEALEAELIGKRPDEIEITAEHLSVLNPIDDVRASGTFRLEAVAEQCRRAIQIAAGTDQGQVDE